MGSFYQNGLVSNVHDFSYGVKGLNNYEILENDLKIYAKKNQRELILPSWYAEQEGKALPKIINEISKTSYLNPIRIGVEKDSKRKYNKYNNDSKK